MKLSYCFIIIGSLTLSILVSPQHFSCMQPTQLEFNEIEKVKEEQKRRLYKIFGENARGTQEERDEKIAEYQRQLVDEEFGDSGNKLRDYQAEGVAWLISNYVNKRSSVLADEVSQVVFLCTGWPVKGVSVMLVRRRKFHGV